MFIKRDHRNLDEILSDSIDPRKYLKLSKRSTEFQGGVSPLCRESNLNSLKNLEALNLYDNMLSGLQGIGLLGQTPLQELNLGCNHLRSLPMEFSRISNLVRLWLDDNQIEEFPQSLCSLKNLEILRLSGNSIFSIPHTISALSNLRTLSLENNRIKEISIGILSLPNLKELWLRQNQIETIPSALGDMTTLEILSISSNKLTELPVCVCNLSNLTTLTANGNMIHTVPDSLWVLPNLQELQLANNRLRAVPVLWEERWGYYNSETGCIISSAAPCQTTTGEEKSTRKVTITLLGNPIERAVLATHGDDVPENLTIAVGRRKQGYWKE